MFRRAFISACVLASAVSATAAAQLAIAPIPAPPKAEPPAWIVGPFKMGMPITEARAAAPTFKWDEVRSEWSKKPIRLDAYDALTIGAFRFDVSLRPGYYGAYAIRLESYMPTKNRAACRKDVVALVGELESRYGAFKAVNTRLPPPRTSAPNIQVTRTPEGVPIVSAAPGHSYGPSREELKAGASSAVETIEGRLQSGDMVWGAEQSRGAARITAGGDFRKGRPDTCSALVVLEYDGQPPKRDIVDASKLVIAATPAPAVLHYSLENVKLPAAGITATATCHVGRLTGNVTSCEDIAPPPMMQAVQQRARETKFDVASIDPDNPVPLYVNMIFKLSPADRMKNMPPQEIPTILMAPPRPPPPSPASSFSRAPTANELYEYYPKKAMRSDIEAFVRVQCTVNADLSLACTSASVTSAHQLDDKMTEEFKRAGLQISKLVRVRNPSRDGKQMVGQSITLPVEFRMPN